MRQVKRKIMNSFILTAMVLNLFNNTNTTTQTGAGQDLSPEMKTFYSKYLIHMAEPELVHNQFGQKHPIPKNGGNTIEFRKYSPLAKALTPLTEGVTPNGGKLNVSTVTATIAQYGYYIELSDLLLLTAIDNNQVQALNLLGSQAGRTLDTVTREVLVGGSNVQYAEGQVASRANLVGGSATAADNHYLTVKAVKMAVRYLRVMSGRKIGNAFVGIIHPDCEFDLTSDPEWKYPHQYVDTKNLYANEIGMIGGVRFVETSEAKVWKDAGKNKETGTAVASDRDVYATLILAADAYGVTEVEGGGLEYFIKQLGSAGSADPLNQRATVGWKATATAARLVEEYMVRIETTSTYNNAPAN